MAFIIDHADAVASIERLLRVLANLFVAKTFQHSHVQFSANCKKRDFALGRIKLA